MQRASVFDLERKTVEKAYAGWAPFYDAICGPFFRPGRRAAAQAACRIGGRILEIGVGTGLSFADYRGVKEIVGIDVSAPMISKARRRAESGEYRNVKNIVLMDAHDLDFSDSTFDCVVAQFVVTLVANPEKVLSECARVVKPGGEIVLINHFYSESGLSAAIERWSAPSVASLGLRPDFPFSRLMHWASSHGGVDLIERRKIEPFRFFTLVRFLRNDSVRDGSVTHEMQPTHSCDDSMFQARGEI